MKKDYDAMVEGLINWPRFRKSPGFDTVRSLMEGLDYRDDIPMIHVVGTNGKGSVAAMTASILRAHGLKVGLFSSPHLVDIRERIKVDGEMVSREAFMEAYDKVICAMEKHQTQGGSQATFFEVMFLMALWHFKASGVDLMIMEAGIGGKNDTTNVLENRLLNIITSISLDHTAILGDTIECIAREKSGIMRKGVKTLAWTADNLIRTILTEAAEKNNAELVEVASFDGVVLERTKDAIDFSLYTKYYSYERLKIHAAADYQLNNAAIAIASVHALGDRYVISPAAVMAGVEAFRWPGRMEYIYPWLLVDGGHNLEGVEAFVQHLNGYETHGTTDLLFVCMNDKELKKMCQAILGIRNLGDIYIPTMPYLRAIDYRMAADTFSDLGFDRVTAIHHLEDFLDNRKREVGARTLLGAIGSLYLVGEIKKYRGGHIVD